MVRVVRMLLGLAACSSSPPTISTAAEIGSSPTEQHCDLAGKLVLDGAPVPYFGVLLTNHYTGALEKRPVVVRSGSGKFCITARHALYDIYIAGPGFARRVIREVNVGDADLGVLEVEPGGMVAGRVVDEQGRPVRDAPVRLSPGYPRSMDREELGDLTLNIHHATTDEDGRYSIGGISVNEWDDMQLEIAVVLPGVGSTGRHRVYTSGETIDLVLHPVGAVEIEVTNNYSVDTSVTIMNDLDHENRLEGVPDESGMVRIADVPAGSYLTIEDRTRTTGPKIVVTGGQTTTASIRLP